MQNPFAGLFTKFPILDINDEFYLRDIRRSDAQAYMDYIAHPKVSEFIPDGCIPKDLTTAEKEVQYVRDLFNRQQSIYWAIARRDDDTLVGTCGFEGWNRFHSRLELAYDLSPDYWRQGLMTAALSAIIDFAFDKMKAARIEAFTTIDNHPSTSLLQKKLNFQQEGTLRGYRFYKGKHVDIFIFGLTQEDHKKSKPKLVGKLLGRKTS